MDGPSHVDGNGPSYEPHSDAATDGPEMRINTSPRVNCARACERPFRGMICIGTMRRTTAVRL